MERRRFESFGAARAEESRVERSRYHALHPEHNRRTMVYVDAVDADGRQYELVNQGRPLDGTGRRVAFDYILPPGVDQLNAVRVPRDTLELRVPPVAHRAVGVGQATFEIDGFGTIFPRQRYGRVILVITDTAFIDSLLALRTSRETLVRRTARRKMRAARRAAADADLEAARRRHRVAPRLDDAAGEEAEAEDAWD